MNTSKNWLNDLKALIARLGPRGRGIIGLVLVIALITGSILQLFPRRVTASTAAPERFSGERAMAHLPILAREPHPSGSAAQKQVRDYLVGELKKIGLETEVQVARNMENVVARLPGSDPTGAIVLLAHYDTAGNAPGAADNGSTVAALLEIMRALASGPALRNDIIALFDDAEEIGPFSGTRAFIRENPWMKDIRLAISIDSAVAGFISTNEVGPADNGWLVHVLAEAYTGGGWMSMSGGGVYNTTPFKAVGIPVLALEDNYPYWQKHTLEDIPARINAGSVQQLGEQTLSIARVVGDKDLSSILGPQETWFPLSFLRIFVHYPESWSLPLAIAAAGLLILAIGLSLWRRSASWKGLGIAFGGLLVLAAISAVVVSLLMLRLPALFDWKTYLWDEWPEVIPPNGWWAIAGLDLLVAVICTAGYILYRRWAKRTDASLAGLVPFAAAGVIMSAAAPRAAYAFLWPAMVGGLGWIVVAILGRKHLSWSMGLAASIAALPIILILVPTIPGIAMADGMKSLNILAGVEALLLAVILPAVDLVLVRPSVRSQ